MNPENLRWIIVTAKPNPDTLCNEVLFGITAKQIIYYFRQIYDDENNKKRFYLYRIAENPGLSFLFHIVKIFGNEIIDSLIDNMIDNMIEDIDNDNYMIIECYFPQTPTIVEIKYEDIKNEIEIEPNDFEPLPRSRATNILHNYLIDKICSEQGEG